MPYLALAFCIILPIFGMAAMEAGAVSPFISEAGSPNGATIAYFIHVVAFFLAYFWIVKRDIASASRQLVARRILLSKKTIDFFAWFCAVSFTSLSLVLIFGFGAKDVLSLDVGKAEFRSNLGSFGAIISLSTKWYIPALFAVLMRICTDFGWTLKRIALAMVACLALIVFALATGFKTTVLQMLLPACILCAWKISLRFALIGGLLVGATIIGLAVVFDQEHANLGLALDALLYRLTVLQSDLSWHTWEVATNNGEMPHYLRTFLPIFGDSMLRLLTGSNPNVNFQEWASYYYGPSMTLFGGYPVEGVIAGTTNQATLFAESVIIGGVNFFPFISFIFGLFAGKITSHLRAVLHKRKYAQCGAVSTLFSFTVLTWTLGTGLSSFFYLINIFGFSTTYLLIRFLLPNKARTSVIAGHTSGL